jgi:hypothetical protein
VGVKRPNLDWKGHSRYCKGRSNGMGEFYLDHLVLCRQR